MKKRIIGIVLSVTMLTGATGSFVQAQELRTPVVTIENTESGEELTEQWFGETTTAGMADSRLGEQWSALLEAYARNREDNFLGQNCTETPIASSNRMGGPQIASYSMNPMEELELLDTSSLETDQNRRMECIREMEERLHISIVDANTTALIKNVIQTENGFLLQLYEWTFFDYIDLDGDGSSVDVSGYGVEHQIVLEKTDTGYEIISDTYDEGELTGMASSDYEKEEVSSQPISNEEATYNGYPLSYDPKKAAAYADKYVNPNIKGSIDSSYYNPAYNNFNGVGGDCTNFASQCLYAGGLPMTDEWYYKSASNYSSTWTFSRYHFQYMSGIGKAVWNPSASDIYMGSPVYYRSAGGQNISHTTICVGTNSAGTPVVNSHNKDYYHVRWNYWGDSANYYTVQMTAKNGVSNGIPAKPVVKATPRPTISGKVLGDLSDNGVIDAADALEILKGVVSLHQFTEMDKRTGDVNGNGKVEADDALYVLKKVVGLIDRFPAE